MSDKGLSIAFFWSIMERFCSKALGVIITIILARLLTPNDFGLLAIITIFINIANQVAQNGFITALIQKRDIIEEDYFSVFNISFIVIIVLYIIIFLSAPIIADFYEIPEIITPFRVLALVMFPAMIQSVLTAKLKRELAFSRFFNVNLKAAIIGGVGGCLLAYNGFGIWALVGQQILGSIAICLILCWSTKWVPKFIINFHRLRKIFSFGWKVLLATLISTLYNNVASLAIGKKYTSETLAYYDRGVWLPSQIAYSLNDAIQNVMLPVLSKYQCNREKCKELMRKSVKITSFVFFPIMALLAAISDSMIKVLLTDKWSECIPYLRIACINFAFFPLLIGNLQAINALGRSDVFLKLEMIKKTLGITVLGVTIVHFDNPMAILLGLTLLTPVELFLNAYPNNKIMGYSVVEQILDFLPNLILSLVMFAVVYMIGKDCEKSSALLIEQICIGIAIYCGLAVVSKNTSYKILLNLLSDKVKVYRRH